MLDTHLKFEATIPYGSKVVAFTSQGITQFFFKFQGQFNLEGEGEGHQFSNTPEILR